MVSRSRWIVVLGMAVAVLVVTSLLLAPKSRKASLVKEASSVPRESTPEVPANAGDPAKSETAAQTPGSPGVNGVGPEQLGIPNPLDDALRGLRQWTDKKLGQSFAHMDVQERGLQRLLPMLESAVLLGENRVTQALEQLEQRIGQLEAGFGSDKPRDVTLAEALALLELGRLYSLTGRFELGHQRVLQGLAAHEQLWERRLQQDHGLAIQVQLCVAQVLHACDQPQEALSHALAAHQQWERLPAGTPTSQRTRLEILCRMTLCGLYQVTGVPGASLDLADKILVDLQTRMIRDQELPELLLLASATHLKAEALARLGRGIEARPLFDEALGLLQRSVPSGHPALGQIRTALADLALQQGDDPGAEDHLRMALVEYEHCFPAMKFPRGHPLLLQARTSLALVLSRLGRAEQALKIHEENTALGARLYPGPHPEKGRLLLLQANAARIARAPEQALRLAREAERLVERLPSEVNEDRKRLQLADCAVQVGAALARLGQTREALSSLERARGLYQEVYPKGHPEEAILILFVAVLKLRKGDVREASVLFRQALVWQQQQTRLIGGTASAAEAMAFAGRQEAALHGFLAACQRLGDTQPDSYAQVWESKGLLTRLLQERRRLRQLAAVGSEEVRRQASMLVDLRGQIACLVHDRGEAPASRERLLAELQSKAERLDRTLPGASGSAVTQELPYTALAEHLNERTAFLDLVRFVDSGSAIPQLRYRAFLLQRGAPLQGIDLGPAASIDTAVQKWRAAIERWNPHSSPEGRRQAEQETAGQAAVLGQQVWQPIRRALLKGVKTVYVALDGDLELFPFYALPGEREGTLLLEEDLLIGYVPNGPFLLEQLLRQPAPHTDADPLLLLANVPYGRPDGRSTLTFGSLKTGPAVLARIQTLAGSRPMTLLQEERATRQAFQQGLSKAAIAYVATHGFFQEKAWSVERALWQNKGTEALLGEFRATPGRSLGLRYPLTFTGLALFRANEGATFPEGIITGDEIAELPLHQLKLAILSACETGLGRPAAGEGVQALQRAFHLAGCRSVVTTLWKCYPEPTDLLLERFCEQLWQQGRPPLEALRAAQREIYYHPERAPVSGNVYGSGTVSEPLTRTSLQPIVTSTSSGPRSTAKAWAAFILSGMGH